MKKRRHTSGSDPIVCKLAEADKLLGEGRTIPEVARALEITESTFSSERNQYGGMKADDAKELRELRRENQRLKKIVADQVLDIDMLKQLNRVNH
ncbi:MAG: transposase [Acidimicrobiales bacterium]